MHSSVGFLSTIVAVTAIAVCSCSQRAPGPTVMDPDAPTEFTTTSSGLKYRILRKSSGRKPQIDNRIIVDYSGWFDDNRVFDSSYGQREPADYRLDAMILGWQEGLQLVGEGGMIELEVPPDLAYGAMGSSPSIPPNATLHFRIELIAVE